MIHIVFNEADVEVLQEAIQIDTFLQGEVLQVKDEYAVGPLLDLYEEGGQATRLNWWRMVLEESENEHLVDSGKVDDYALVKELKERLDHDTKEVIWIWVGQNKHDVSGYYWLLHFFPAYEGRIHILYLNNLPFLNEKGHLFYPQWLSTIPSKEFIKAKKLARPITASEFEIDQDEWNRLCNENKGVRLLEGGKKLVQREYDHYDADLKKYISQDWQKASRVIHQFLSRNKETTGDMFLLWRIKQMIADNQFEFQGQLKGTKDFEIRMRAGQMENTE